MILAQVGKEEEIPKIFLKAVQILDEKAKYRTVSGIIRFSEVYFILGTYFRLTKSEARDFLKHLARAGLIEVVPFNGIRIINAKPSLPLNQAALNNYSRGKR